MLDQKLSELDTAATIQEAKLRTIREDLTKKRTQLPPDADPAAAARRLAEIDKELATLATLWEQAASELAFHEAE